MLRTDGNHILPNVFSRVMGLLGDVATSKSKEMLKEPAKGMALLLLFVGSSIGVTQAAPSAADIQKQVDLNKHGAFVSNSDSLVAKPVQSPHANVQLFRMGKVDYAVPANLGLTPKPYTKIGNILRPNAWQPQNA